MTYTPKPTSSEVILSTKRKIFLSNCGVAQLHPSATKEITDFLTVHQQYGHHRVIEQYDDILDDFKQTFGQLLQTSADNIAAVKNASEAISMIAEGYPFEEGDEVLSFVHEYPANHFPWKLQARKKGIRLKLVPNVPYKGFEKSFCGSWKLAHIKAFISPRTRIIAISHVQFTSGFAGDLMALGALCKEHNIDLIVDAAQSLGSIPIDPEAMNIAALAASGWKWLMGPIGVGVFYTAPAFRAKLNQVIIGAETMQQCPEYLDHSWNPHTSAKRFEYSTSPISLLKGLTKVVKENHLKMGVPLIHKRLLKLQDIFLAHLENKDFTPILFPKKYRSGILSLYHPRALECSEILKEQGITCSSKGGYLRVAPNFQNSEEDMRLLADILFAFES